MSRLWWFVLALSILLNLYFLFPIFLEKVAKVPARAIGTYGLISRDDSFLDATIAVLDTMGLGPLCTAHSDSSPNLHRYLCADGRLYNFDDNEAFLAELGNPTAFHAFESRYPEADAESMAEHFVDLGFNARVVPHYDPDMRGKMYFISFRDSLREPTYNPGWVFAWRLPGRKMGSTTPWRPGS